MTARFGRNKRRRAREALAAANDQIAGLQGLGENYRNQIAGMHREVRDAETLVQAMCRTLGQHFFGLAPTERGTYDYPETGPIMHMLPMSMESAAYFSQAIKDGANMATAASHIDNGYVLCDLFEIEAVRKVMQQQVHFLVRRNGRGAGGYAVSAANFARADRRFLVSSIAQGLAQIVADELAHPERAYNV